MEYHVNPHIGSCYNERDLIELISIIWIVTTYFPPIHFEFKKKKKKKCIK